MVVSLRVIVMEARELFREYGYGGASMRDLADRVNAHSEFRCDDIASGNIG